MLLVNMDDVHNSVGRVAASVFFFFFLKFVKEVGWQSCRGGVCQIWLEDVEFFLADEDLKKEVFC